MGRIVVLIALFAAIGVGAAGFAIAQDAPAPPGADAEFCASPEASPGASPEASPGASPAASPGASPEIITDGSPAAVATSVTEGIEGGLDSVVCGTPAASPAA